MKKFVYLAGPILGCGHSEANDWRKHVAAGLEQHGIVGVSPLRCEPIVGDKYAATYDDPKFGTSRAIGAKNYYDTRACDMVLVYLPKPAEGRHQSYGTLIEIGWAYTAGKPIVLVSDDPTITSHPVVNSCASWVLDTLEQAEDVLIGILGGYTGGKNV